MSKLDDIETKIPWRINGTEANSKEAGERRSPDTEDLGYDGITFNNSYFHAEILFDKAEHFPLTSPPSSNQKIYEYNILNINCK